MPTGRTSHGWWSGTAGSGPRSATGHRIRAAAAVLCTNGFVDHEVETPRR